MRWGQEEGVTDQRGLEVRDFCLTEIPTALGEKRANSARVRPLTFLPLGGRSPFTLGLIICLTFLTCACVRWRQRQAVAPRWDVRESNEE